MHPVPFQSFGVRNNCDFKTKAKLSYHLQPICGAVYPSDRDYPPLPMQLSVLSQGSPANHLMPAHMTPLSPASTVSPRKVRRAIPFAAPEEPLPPSVLQLLCEELQGMLLMHEARLVLTELFCIDFILFSIAWGEQFCVHAKQTHSCSFFCIP